MFGNPQRKSDELAIPLACYGVPFVVFPLKERKEDLRFNFSFEYLDA